MKTIIGAIIVLFATALLINWAYGFSVQGQSEINNATRFGIQAMAGTSTVNEDSTYAQEGSYRLNMHGLGGNLAVINNYTSETGVSELSVRHVPSGRGSYVGWTEKAGVSFVTEENCCAGAGGSQFRADGGIEAASSADNFMGLYAVSAQGAGRFAVEAVENQIGEGIYGLNHAQFKITGTGNFMTNHSLEFGCGGITTEAGPDDVIPDGIFVLCPWDQAKKTHISIFHTSPASEMQVE